MTKLSPFTDTPAVTLALDGQPIGPPQTVTQSPGTCSGGFATYAFEQDFPSGMPNYVRSGENLLTVAVSGTSFGVEVATFLANVEVTWPPGVDIRLLAGEGQIGCVGSPTAQALRVQLSSAAGLPLAGKQENFAVGSA